MEERVLFQSGRPVSPDSAVVPPMPEMPYCCGRFAGSQMMKQKTDYWRVQCVSGANSGGPMTKDILHWPNISVFNVCCREHTADWGKHKQK